MQAFHSEFDIYICFQIPYYRSFLIKSWKYQNYKAIARSFGLSASAVLILIGERWARAPLKFSFVSASAPKISDCERKFALIFALKMVSYLEEIFL